MENDGSAALILTTASRARDSRKRPAYVMAAAQGSDYRHGATIENSFDYSSSNFKTLSPRLFEMAGITAQDVDCTQIYEHFSAVVMVSLAEHGFCQPEEVMEFVKFENITAPDGKLPVNTSGGNIAECYMHGLEVLQKSSPDRQRAPSYGMSHHRRWFSMSSAQSSSPRAHPRATNNSREAIAISV